jgi:hypothetical protein
MAETSRLNRALAFRHENLQATSAVRDNHEVI